MSAPLTALDRDLDAIYAEIPRIPDCNGKCAAACGPIACFKGEWDRVRRANRGPIGPLRPGLVCPQLSPSGRCRTYGARPFVCRVWGTTPALRCPEGCEPERWLSAAEAHEIFLRIQALAGPQVAGTISTQDLWEAMSLEHRERRQALIDTIRQEAADARG